jgi:hypothetical protein
LVNFIDLTNAMVATLQAIPGLLADLEEASPESVIGYIDNNPKRNSVSNAIYRQRPGTVLVVWQETTFNQGGMEPWSHRIELYVRAMSGASAMTLIDDIVNGIPDPGDGQRWHYCPIMAGLLPTNITGIARLIDEEGIDYFVIQTETPETGDL